MTSRDLFHSIFAVGSALPFSVICSVLSVSRYAYYSWSNFTSPPAAHRCSAQTSSVTAVLRKLPTVQILVSIR